MQLSADQQQALDEIKASVQPGRQHVLTGYAGSGKTTLMQEVARHANKSRKSIIFTAPTHKAVAVLSRKLAAAGLGDIPCRTLQSLLNLTPKVEGDRQVFTRKKYAEPVEQDIVGIDECSMVSKELNGFVKRHLQQSFVLYLGDPAQLPPVGEKESETFSVANRSHLSSIIRQAEGHPILDAAQILRKQQGSAMDWSWCASKSAPPYGIFRPTNPQAWMQKAFTSDEFSADADSFRYLCWTNAKVASVNSRVRQWRYGPNILTPFVAGERALFRSPITIDGTLAVATNEEVEVLEIEPSVFRMEFDTREGAGGWKAEVASWRVLIRTAEGNPLEVHAPREDGPYNAVLERLAKEAGSCRQRWHDRFEFQSRMARMQSIYAMTVHTSQGSTFKNVFMDVPDIRQRVQSNTLEAQQLFYVGATRPTHALMLLGAP